MNYPWKNLSGDAKRALLVHALYWQLMALGGGFINIYLDRLADSLAQPALYLLVFNLTIPFAFWLGGKEARKGGSPRSLRFGLVLLEVYFLAFLLLQGRAVDFLFPLALLGGMATGYYWLGFMLLVMELANDHQRHAFFATGQSGLFFANLSTAPLVGLFLAWMPGLAGYTWMFAAAVLLGALAIYLSLPLKTPPLRRSGSILRLLKARKPRGWWAHLWSNMLMGMASVASLFLAGLMAYEALGNESGAGSYSLVNAIFGLITAWLVAGRLQPHNRRKMMFWSALLIAALTLPLAFDRALPLVLLYGAGMAVMQSLFGVPMVSTHMALIDAAPRFQARREEVMVIREVFINLGRAVLLLYLYLMITWGQEQALTHVFALLAIVPLINWWLMKKYV